MVSLGAAGIHRDGAPKLGLGAGPVAVYSNRTSPRATWASARVLSRASARIAAAGRRHDVAGPNASAVVRPVRAGEPGPCQGEGGVEPDRFLIEVDRGRSALRATRPMVPGLEIRVVRLEARGRQRQPRPDRPAGDPQRSHRRWRDLVLDQEHVAGRPLVGLRPEIEPFVRAHQMHDDPEAVTGLTHAAFQHRGDPEPAADLAGVLLSPLEAKADERARDPEPGHPVQGGGQLLGHPVAEVLVGGVGAGVDQREDARWSWASARRARRRARRGAV